MASLASQRCLHHSGREAVARCPECGRFFCRECIVEHEDRVICAGCLTKLADAQNKAPSRIRLAALLPAVGVWLGLLVAWLVFYFVGRTLLSVPDDFRAGKVWKADWLHSDMEARK